jgi:hypothetical protein
MEIALVILRVALLAFALWSLARAGLLAAGRLAAAEGAPTRRRRVYRNLRNAAVSAVLALALGEIGVATVPG